MRTEFTLPVQWNKRVKGKSVKYILSFNQVLARGYRWYQTRKKHFHVECKKQLTGKEPVGLTSIPLLTYHIGCSAKQDLMNVGSVIDKFFQDFLVTEGIIVDDNIRVIQRVTFIGETVPRADIYAKVTVSWH